MEPFPPHFLESPLWSPWRQLIIAAHGNVCKHCSNIATYPFIQPVEIVHGRMPWDYRIGEVQVVCRECYYTGVNRVADFYSLLGNFTQEEQLLIISVTGRILRESTPERQIGVERMRATFERRLDKSTEEINPEAFSEETVEVLSAMIISDPPTLEPLIESIGILLKMSPFSRGVALAFVRDSYGIGRPLKQ